MINYFKKEYEKGLWSMESITLIYMLFTTVLIGIYWNGITDPMGMLMTRGVMLAAMSGVYALYRWYPCRALRILRVVLPLLGLAVWYPETYDFCSHRLRENLLSLREKLAIRVAKIPIKGIEKHEEASNSLARSKRATIKKRVDFP